MMKKPNKKTVLIVSVLVILCLGIWTLWGNIALEVNEYEIVSDRIPEAFAGFRIAQVSDLHNKDFGEGYGQLLTLLSQINPDIIVVTGDLIDSRQTDLDIALEFAWQAGKIARVYYVSGNHEARVPEYEDLKIGLVKAGVVIFENQKVQIILLETGVINAHESNTLPFPGYLDFLIFKYHNTGFHKTNFQILIFRNTGFVISGDVIYAGNFAGLPCKLQGNIQISMTGIDQVAGNYDDIRVDLG